MIWIGRDEDVEPYDEPRGTCVRCGSPSVSHLVIGLMPPGAPDEDPPDWVRSVGCVHPGYDRECQSCGFTWEAGEKFAPTPR